MHRIESQSRRRVAIRSETNIVLINPPAHAGRPSRAPHRRRRRPWPHCPDPHHRPRPRHRLRRPRARGRHRHPWCNSERMGHRVHHSAPLRLYAHWEKNHKTCEDNLADHCTHLKTRRAEPFPNQPSPIRRMRPPRHRFQCNSISSCKSPRASCPQTPPSNGTSSFRIFPIPSSLSPIPLHCAITIEPWNAPRSGSQPRVQAEPAQAAALSAGPLQYSPSPVARPEDPSRYCPICSQRLESRRCKLICSVCGYYMSCADCY